MKPLELGLICLHVSTMHAVCVVKLRAARAVVSGSLPPIPPHPAGPANKQILESEGIPTTHALIGVYLTIREKDMTIQKHCDAFWQFLAAKKINSGRAAIVRAVAEKVNTWIPGSFDESAFPEKQSHR